MKAAHPKVKWMNIFVVPEMAVSLKLTGRLGRVMRPRTRVFTSLAAARAASAPGAAIVRFRVQDTLPEEGKVFNDRLRGGSLVKTT